MDGTQIKLADVCEEWLRMKRLSVKQSTYARYVRHVQKHIVPQLGEMKLGEINSSVVNQFIYEKMESGRLDHPGALSAKTVRDISIVLRSILRYAEEEYQVHRLAINAVLPKRKKTEPEILNAHELRRIRELAQRDCEDARSTGLLLCMYTGLRLGEICALRWSDIDVKRRTICVSHTLQRIPSSSCEQRTRIITDEPKTASSCRIIPIPAEIYPEIRRQYRDAVKNCYFLSGTEHCVEPRNYQYFFKRVLQEAGVRHVKFHTLRHTFATRCVELGMDVKTLSEILGHSSTNITMNYYVHCSMESRRKMMNRFKI